MRGDIKVFSDGIDPNDINQGALGDCWFLSALASLAENAGLIKRLFVTQEYNKEGIYKVKFCKNGEWIVVTVDDYIPCRANGGPMFSRGTGNELWVMLLEKAYAKIHGNYRQLSSGFPEEALMDLTGCPIDKVSFPRKPPTGDEEEEEEEEYDEDEEAEKAENLWHRLVEFDESGYLMTTETSGLDTYTE